MCMGGDAINRVSTTITSHQSRKSPQISLASSPAPFITQMKQSLLLSLCLCFAYSTATYSQSKIDSLKYSLSIARDDTSKINRLNLLAQALFDADDSTAFSYAAQAQTLADKSDYLPGRIESRLITGRLHLAYHHGTQAKQFFEDALELCSQSDNISFRARAHDGLARTYYHELSNPSIALYHNLEALKLFEQTGNQLMIGKCYQLSGDVYDDKKELPEALQSFRKSLAIMESIRDTNMMAMIHTNIADVTMQQKQYDLALFHSDHALDLYVRHGLKSPSWGKAWAYSYLGAICFQLGEAAFTAGDLTLAQQQYEEALCYYQERLRLELEVRSGSVDSYVALAVWYLTMFNHGLDFDHSDHVAIAKHYVDLALPNAVDRHLVMNISSSYELRSYIDSIEGHYFDAFNHFKLSRVYQDSVWNTESNSKTARLQLQYEFDKANLIAANEHEKQQRHQRNILDSILAVLGGSLVFASVILRQHGRLRKARQRSDELLLNILPAETAEELKAKGSAASRLYDDTTVLFTDFVRFTEISEQLSATELVAEIDVCFKAFDEIIQRHNIEKIKTIGDSYMAASGLPLPNPRHAQLAVQAAIDLRDFVTGHVISRLAQGKPAFEIRIGLHTGPVVAGIVGIKKFQYDLWGDTVNTASRMESTSEPGRIHISKTTYERLKDDPAFTFTARGKVEVKGKGEMETWFVERGEHMRSK